MPGRYDRVSIQVESLPEDSGQPHRDRPHRLRSAWLYCLHSVPFELASAPGAGKFHTIAEYSAELHAGYTERSRRDGSLRREWGGYER